MSSTFMQSNHSSPASNGHGSHRRARAVVTGASSGIGRALAGELAERGYPLLLVARRTDRLEELATRLRVQRGVDVEVWPCDLADSEQLAALAEELRARRVSVLCDNAGFTTCGPVSEADPAREAQAVAVNVTAAHELVLAVLPGMLERNEGAILVTGSAAGEQPVPSAATYAATKAFVNAFAQALSVELHGTSVTCTLLSPGPVRTEFFDVGGVGRMEAVTRFFSWQSPERVARDAVLAMERGRRIIIPGPVAKVQAVGGRYMPRALLFPLLRLIFLPIVRFSARPKGRPAPVPASSHVMADAPTVGAGSRSHR
jgi:short-subunit dehydrogenase